MQVSGIFMYQIPDFLKIVVCKFRLLFYNFTFFIKYNAMGQKRYYFKNIALKFKFTDNLRRVL